MPPSKKRVCILGSTGSIGLKTLQVIEDYPEEFEVAGISARGSADALAAQAQRWRPRAACLSGAKQPPNLNGATRWFAGDTGLLELLDFCEPDIVVVAVVGAAGLAPTLRAIELGAAIALANKETLVTAGRLVMRAAAARGVPILPIDSEHNAIAQCLAARGPGHELRRIILTASGGPFRGWTREQLAGATLESALRHPTWAMGPKITVDSATLMNKGFEVIEGHHLFAVPVDQIEVVVHPQSVIHSMIEFVDGSMLAQMGATDMYFPIANALAHPRRLPNTRFGPLDLARVGRIDFESYDAAVFPCLSYAYEAARRGGTYPAVLNAANEAAVGLFLEGRLRLTEIAEAIDAALQAHEPGDDLDLDAIRRADAWARGRCGSPAFGRAS